MQSGFLNNGTFSNIIMRAVVPEQHIDSNTTPVSSGTIDAMERRVDITGDCSVCMTSLDGATCIKLRCGHAFHEQCIVRWMERRNTCPMCRDVIESEHRRGEAEADASQESATSQRMMVLRRYKLSITLPDDTNIDTVWDLTSKVLDVINFVRRCESVRANFMLTTVISGDIHVTRGTRDALDLLEQPLIGIFPYEADVEVMNII